MSLLRRLLVWLLALWALVVVVRIFRKASARRRPAPAGALRFEGAMVRDRICQTFLPRGRALVLRLAGEEHFFCSEDCRRAFLSSRGQAPARPLSR